MLEKYYPKQNCLLGMTSNILDEFHYYVFHCIQFIENTKQKNYYLIPMQFDGAAGTSEGEVGKNVLSGFRNVKKKLNNKQVSEYDLSSHYLL